MFPSVRWQRHGVFICREALHLRRFGIECAFLVGRPWTPWPLSRLRRWSGYGSANPLRPPDGLQAQRVGYFRAPGLGFRLFEGKSLAGAAMGQAVRWHEEEPFDLVLGVSMFPDAEAAVAIATQLNLPVASLAVGSDVMVYPQRLPALWQRLGDTLERVDLPLGVSRSICDTLAETGRCRREPQCVYLSRDEGVFTPAADKDAVRAKLGWAKDAVVAVYIGGLVESKGLRELAAACEPLLERYRSFTLVCVGAGPMHSTLSGLARRVGRSGAVVLTGAVGPDEVPLLLQGADFLVLPSHSEGMPQAILEAMDCGLPVVATRVGGIPEAVIDGQTGLLVEEGNPEQLRSAIERLICDEHFRLSAGREGRARASNVFDSQTNAGVFADMLRLAAGRTAALTGVACD